VRGRPFSKPSRGRNPRLKPDDGATGRGLRVRILPGCATDRVLVADIIMLEEWSLRVLAAASLEEVIA
jgi:hypothetical protein